MKTIEVQSFEDAAVLRQAGFRFIEANPCGRHVTVIFADPKNKAAKALQAHENSEYCPPSCELFNSLGWAKRIVFSAKTDDTNGGFSHGC